MSEVGFTPNPRLCEPTLRLPLAGTRIRASRGDRWSPPPRNAAPPRIESLDVLQYDARRLAVRESQCRLVQARLIAALMKRRLWRPLGFVRLPDYAAERLGMHARSLQEDARVVTALEILPRLRAALATGALRWTHGRLIAGVANPASQDEWLQLALTSTTRQLAERVKAARNAVAAKDGQHGASGSARADQPLPAGADPDVCASRGFAGVALQPGTDPDACASLGHEGVTLQTGADPDACASPACTGVALRPGTDPDACASVGHEGVTLSTGADPDACASRDSSTSAILDDDDAADPPHLWSIDVTRPGRRLWRVVGDLASHMCGTDVPASRVAEVVAAEAITWDVWEPPGAEPLPPRAPRQRTSLESPEAGVLACEPGIEPDAELETLLLALDSADAHEVDRRLRIVRAAMQRIDADLGAVLRRAYDQNVPRRLGFSDLRPYAELRLGICGSKAMALVRLDRLCAMRSPALLSAYREGRVTWLAATTLLPVISRHHEHAWVRRASQVTLRRLEAEVSWALDRADDSHGRTRQAPPPLDLDVTADALARCSAADIQMRAHPETDLASFSRHVDARIGVVLPESVAMLLDDAIEGCRHAIEPRWRGFERILAHAWTTWMSLPQHDNPVYARDSHRCQVPACRNRGRLHAHHIWFRSRGGPDDSWNLVTVCDEHHQAIHRGEIHVRGRAPGKLVWEMGCRAGHRPLLRLRGEVYLDDPRAGMEAIQAARAAAPDTTRGSSAVRSETAREPSAVGPETGRKPSVSVRREPAPSEVRLDA